MQSITASERTGIAHLLFLSAIALLMCSCATAPQYDAKADNSIDSIQGKIHLMIDNWISGTKSLKWEKNKSFYDEVDSSLKSLELRMEATPDPSTANLPIVFSNLNAELKNMKDLHRRQGTLSAFYLRAEQQQLDAQFATLLTYELSLKVAVTGGATQSTATAQNPAGSAGRNSAR